MQSFTEITEKVFEKLHLTKIKVTRENAIEISDFLSNFPTLKPTWDSYTAPELVHAKRLPDIENEIIFENKVKKTIDFYLERRGKNANLGEIYLIIGKRSKEVTDKLHDVFAVQRSSEFNSGKPQEELQTITTQNQSDTDTDEVDMIVGVGKINIKDKKDNDNNQNQNPAAQIPKQAQPKPKPKNSCFKCRDSSAILKLCTECELNYCISTCSEDSSAHPCYKLKTKPKKVIKEPLGQLQAKHPGVVCDDCSCEVIGTRYFCQNCGNFDLCSNCYTKYPGYSYKHSFLEFRESSSYTRVSDKKGDYFQDTAGGVPVDPPKPSSSSRINSCSSSRISSSSSNDDFCDVFCDGCDRNISDKRVYECRVCIDYNLCKYCYDNDVHIKTRHKFRTYK